jgi:iron complex transport system substrate-binding protein
MKKSPYILFGIIVLIIVIVVFSKYRERFRAGLDENQQIEKNKPPQRIVSLAPNITEILFALGLGDRVVAVSNDCDYPAAVLEKNKVGSFWQPNTEAIIAFKPDLVITLWFDQQEQVARSLQRLNYKVITLKLEKIDELATGIEKIAAATSTQQKAQKLIEDIEDKLNQLHQRFDKPDKPAVLWVVQPEPLRIAGVNTFVSELITIAGGKNAIGPTLQQYPQLSTEELITCGAQVIIQSAMSRQNIEQQQKNAELFWSAYKDLPAVKNGRIHVINPDTVLRLGPRLPEGVELIGNLIHTQISETTR